MPRVALSQKQRMDYKLLGFKRWVRDQIDVNHISQKEVGDAIGVSQGRVSQMIKLPDKRKKGEKINPDPFTIGQMLALFELFGTDEEERKKLLTL